MKKILIWPAVLFVTLTIAPAFSCTEGKNGEITGAACSIKELNNLETRNKILENGQTAKFNWTFKPQKSNSELLRPDDKDCLFGMCLYKTILGE